MHGRRIFHARGKVLGGSSSINGQIFQRGNPLDYERWATDPGMAIWDFAHCLPYFKKMETRAGRGAERSVARPRRAARARAWTRRRTRCSARSSRAAQAGRLSADRRRQRLSSGRLRAVRSQHPRRPTPECGPRLPPSDPARAGEPRGLDASIRDGHRLRRIARDRGRCGAWARRSWRGRPLHRRRGDPGRGRDQQSAAPVAGRHRPGRRARKRSGSRCRPTGPASGATSRTTSRSTSSTRVSCPCLDATVRDPALAATVHRRTVAVPCARARGVEPFRGRRFRRGPTST